MNVNELFNNEEYKDNLNWLEISINKLYYSNRGYFLKKYMEIDEFRNEVYLRLLKYWKFDEYNGALNTYLGTIAESTMLHIYQNMDRNNRKLNYDDTLERFDKEINEGESPIIIKHEDSFIREQEAIEYIAKGVNNKEDYIIIKLYLLGYSMTDIAKHLNTTWRMVQYRVKNKYNDMMKERFNEYVNSKIS